MDSSKCCEKVLAEPALKNREQELADEVREKVAAILIEDKLETDSVLESGSVGIIYTHYRALTSYAAWQQGKALRTDLSSATMRPRIILVHTVSRPTKCPQGCTGRGRNGTSLEQRAANHDETYEKEPWSSIQGKGGNTTPWEGTS